MEENNPVSVSPPVTKFVKGDVEGDLYEKRQKVYPREVHGIFAILKTSAVIALLGLFFLLPWAQLNDRQVVLFDLPARKFYVFWLTFWPQDFLLLAFLLMLAAISLFFFTALAGRLWCGYACPQTVWTDVFIRIERKFEGSRLQQMTLDKVNLSMNKIMKKTGKHFSWLLISLMSAFTFVAYFSPARELLIDFLHFQLHPWQAFWIAFFTLSTYINAGWMREQVCMYMCPYARFQSAMYDDDTLVISYDEKRGDPKGARSPGTDHRRQGLGDCIDCKLCVQVCPTGIDIRKGLQYECISCSSCIDVCDYVMDKMGYERGLVRYTTQNLIDGKPSRIIRPRLIIDFVILLIMSSAFAYTIISRVPLELDVIRDRNQLYRETAGLIENVYTLKLINMDDITHEYTLSVEGIENLQLITDGKPVIVEAGSVLAMPVVLRSDESALSKRSTDVRFKLTANDEPDLSVIETAKFLGPLQ